MLYQFIAPELQLGNFQFVGITEYSNPVLAGPRRNYRRERASMGSQTQGIIGPHLEKNAHSALKQEIPIREIPQPQKHRGTSVLSMRLQGAR